MQMRMLLNCCAGAVIVVSAGMGAYSFGFFYTKLRQGDLPVALLLLGSCVFYTTLGLALVLLVLTLAQP